MYLLKASNLILREDDLAFFIKLALFVRKMFDVSIYPMILSRKAVKRVWDKIKTFLVKDFKLFHRSWMGVLTV